MTVLIFIFLATCFLAYSNGANDNFKGVATLFGSGTTNYRGAIRWATVTTFAGSISSIILAGALVQRFSGKGLVPDALAASPDFLLSVATGAGFTVILATLTGFPISTTHSLATSQFRTRHPRTFATHPRVRFTNTRHYPSRHRPLHTGRRAVFVARAW